MSSKSLSVCLGFMFVWREQLCHYFSFDLNPECMSSAVTSLSLVAGVRSSRCAPPPVGVGRRSAPLLRSSRSRSFTTRSWNTNNEHRSSFFFYFCFFFFYIFSPPLTPEHSTSLMLESYYIPFFCGFFFTESLTSSTFHHNSFLRLPDYSRCLTFRPWSWIWRSL